MRLAYSIGTAISCFTESSGIDADSAFQTIYVLGATDEPSSD